MTYNNVRGAHSRRARLLATVGTAALATFLTAAAQAQYASVTVNTFGDATINGTAVGNSLDNPAADIRASVIDTIGATVIDNVVAQTSQVIGNTMTADAIANLAPTTINLVDQNLTAENGIASLVQMVNDGLARSLVDNNILMTTTPGERRENEIVATTVANKASTITSGVAPATNLGGAGSSYTTLRTPDFYYDDILHAEGGIISSILQTNYDDYDDSDLNPDFARGNSAVADGNEISLDVLFSHEDGTAVSLEVEKNKIAAGYTGNSATNQVALANGAPTFEGSVIVVTGQDNRGVDFGNPYTGAFNTDTWIGSYAESEVLEVNDETFWAPFSGELNVADNAITASATGNSTVGTDGAAGNSIQLEGVSFAGANEEEAHVEAYAYDYHQPVSMINIRADLGVANRQRNDSTNVTAEVDWADIEGYADDLEEGSVNVSANTIGATANGSNGSNAIRVEGAPLFSGTAAVGNVQDLAYSAVTATIESSDIYAGGGYEESGDFEVARSNISATGNGQRAVATGNIIAQQIAIDATTIALGTPVWSAGWSDYVEAEGSLVVSNLQVATFSSAFASVDDSSIIAEADEAAAIGSRIDADGNLQEARAIGNAATNSLLLNGGTVGIGGGITNIQSNWAGNSEAYVNAIVEAGADYTSGGTTALTDNTQLAVAMSNNAGNRLLVEGTTLDGVVRSPDSGGGVGFELSNDQFAASGAIAEVLNHDGQEVFEAFADGDLYQSSLLNERNTAAAVAVGNQVANSLDLEFVTLASVDSDLDHVARLDNEQASYGYIEARLGGAELIEADVDGSVDGSGISVSDNVLDASAYRNIANNALNVKGQKVITDGLVSRDYDLGAFVVQNYQDAWGHINASQNDGEPTSIEIEVGSDVLDSTLTLAGNRSTTQVLGNLSDNALTLTATDLRSSARLESDQYNQAFMSVSAGGDDVPPTPGTEDAPFTVSAKAELIGGFNGEGYDVTGGYFTVALDELSSDQISYMDANGWELFTNGEDLTVLRIPAEPWFPGTFTGDEIAWWESPAGVYAFNYSLPGLPGDLGSPNGGGVLVDLKGDLSGSTVNIAGNTASANAIANSVSNSMTVSATRLEAETRFYLETVYDQDNLPVDEQAIVIEQTDFDLDNDQEAGDGDFAHVQVNIFGSYGVTTNADFDATDSKIEIKDNTQSVLALANAATNAVTLAATNIGGEESYGATSRLESDQDSDAGVNASSDLQLFAPLKGEGTSVAISGNTNAAYAGMNDVINTLKVSGTSISGGRFTTDSADFGGSEADHVLDNDQDAGGWIDSEATTTIVNNEIDMLIAEGIDSVANLTGGSVAVNGNVTSAEVNANRAVNSVALTGVASQTASAALRNRQDNDASVTATATTNAALFLNGGTESEQSALVDGSIVLNGNVTEAIARGNNAINTMTVGTTGSNSVNATLDPSGDATASGPALIVNRQTNDNSVSATASATYGVILNADGVQAATGSTVAVTGNVVNAVAFGNRASNVLTLNAMPGGTTGGAVVSSQTNNGAITATASSVIFGVGIPSSGMQSAQTGVSGNQIAASAVGNSVTTTINIGR